jgi:hypothetical protein
MQKSDFAVHLRFHPKNDNRKPALLIQQLQNVPQNLKALHRSDKLIRFI